MKKTYWKLFVAALAAVMLTACQSGDAGTTPADPSEITPPPAVAAPAEDTEESSSAEGITDKEDPKTFVAGTSFSGTKRPTVDSDARYLTTEAVDPPQNGKIIYSVNSKTAGKVEGNTVQNAGNASAEVRAVPELGYKFIEWSDGVKDASRSGDTAEGVYTAIFDYDVLDMPIVVINTDDGDAITSKTVYETAKISFLGCDRKYLIEDAVTEIRGRGNNSWGYPKKSFKFKLAEKKNLFDLANGKEKIWVLLANQCDQSLQRNHVSFEYARYFDAVEWQPNSTSVEVYLNGEYVGVYLLAEEIKISEDRVNVDDRDINKVDTGYLLELSNYASGEVINAAGRTYMIHNDLSEDRTTMREQKKFIEDYVDECYEALAGGSREKCEELIDLDSLAAVYLVEEMVKNLDSQWDSFYLHKDAGGKLVFGPVWDFDLSLGNANEGAEEYTDIFVGNGRGSGGGFG
ncbi:MAG: CotH kinase family protein, partial [Clostridia bacterium]|nr:CotH kinase family protein [Clostridia bacterium]